MTDTGAGIPAEMLSRIFEPFEQVDASMTRRHGGLGLGLAIARQIVVAHGGSIEAHSEGAGRGASFTVTLPAIDPPPLAAASTDATFTEHHALVGSRPRRRR